MDETLVDRIYEAAAVPELWSGAGVLNRLAEMTGCTDGVMLATDGSEINGWVTNTSVKPKIEVYMRDHWIRQNPYVHMETKKAVFAQPRFILDTEVMSASEMAESGYYQNFMRPYGMYWHAGTDIRSPSGDTIKLSVHRGYDLGPLDPSATERMNALRPHLARASLVTARLRFEQVRAAVEAFNLIGLASAAVRRGHLMVCNKAFEALVPDVVQDRRDRLRFVQSAADTCWKPLIGKLVSTGRTFQIAASPGQPARIAHVLPLVGASRDIFTVADALIVIVNVQDGARVDSEILLGLFDLTNAESQIVQELLRGRTLAEIAKLRGVTVNTVRFQLKVIFDKTGTHRQADLIQLVSGARLH